MNKMIAHRGPDNEGLYQSKNYACAFSRLSIIDINNRSNQPFTDSKKRFYLVYNGEIYNFLELRSELINTGIKFATSSDTEVLFQSFIKWGPNCVNKFIGMFAFVIFDKNTVVSDDLIELGEIVQSNNPIIDYSLIETSFN